MLGPPSRRGRGLRPESCDHVSHIARAGESHAIVDTSGTEGLVSSWLDEWERRRRERRYARVQAEELENERERRERQREEQRRADESRRAAREAIAAIDREVAAIDGLLRYAISDHERQAREQNLKELQRAYAELARPISDLEGLLMSVEARLRDTSHAADHPALVEQRTDILQRLQQTRSSAEEAASAIAARREELDIRPTEADRRELLDRRSHLVRLRRRAQWTALGGPALAKMSIPTVLALGCCIYFYADVDESGRVSSTGFQENPQQAVDPRQDPSPTGPATTAASDSLQGPTAAGVLPDSDAATVSEYVQAMRQRVWQEGVPVGDELLYEYRGLTRPHDSEMRYAPVPWSVGDGTFVRLSAVAVLRPASSARDPGTLLVTVRGNYPGAPPDGAMLVRTQFPLDRGPGPVEADIRVRLYRRQDGLGILSFEEYAHGRLRVRQLLMGWSRQFEQPIAVADARGDPSSLPRWAHRSVSTAASSAPGDSTRAESGGTVTRSGTSPRNDPIPVPYPDEECWQDSLTRCRDLARRDPNNTSERLIEAAARRCARLAPSIGVVRCPSGQVLGPGR